MVPPPPPLVGADRAWALFLDVDGTLLDFAPDPDRVEVDPHLREDLVRIRGLLGGALALLSGRSLAQLDEFFGWQGRAAAGLHGVELRMPDGHEQAIGDATAFAAVRAQAKQWIDAVPGLHLEDKLRTLVVHYRRVPGKRGDAERIARGLLEQAGPAYALQYGDHMIELKPGGIDKGGALDRLMADPPFRGRRPWMLGDDLTDEHAFVRVNALAGVSVIVGSRRPTEARYALTDPPATRAWLHGLAQAMQAGSA